MDISVPLKTFAKGIVIPHRDFPRISTFDNLICYLSEKETSQVVRDPYYV